ncbi:hypothetical protein MMC24_004003 [Lignoscripta atroalba]|nr:hypothetical protein [Lignoscripta atroalba]
MDLQSESDSDGVMYDAVRWTPLRAHISWLAGLLDAERGGQQRGKQGGIDDDQIKDAGHVETPQTSASFHHVLHWPLVSLSSVDQLRCFTNRCHDCPNAEPTIKFERTGFCTATSNHLKNWELLALLANPDGHTEVWVHSASGRKLSVYGRNNRGLR